MKKLFRIAGIVLGIFILIIICAAIYINYAPPAKYAYNPPNEYPIKMSPELLAEGARMAQSMCVNCHLSPDGKLGGALMDDATQFGKIYSANITQDPEYGIVDYTNEELAYLLRTGMKRDGEYSPFMLKFPNLSDRDLKAIITFLKSDHPLIAPSQRPTQKSELNFLGKFLWRVAFEPLPYPKKEIPEPDTSDKVAFGKYVLTAKFDCLGCHSASFSGMDLMVPENSEGYLAGGNELHRKNGEKILTPNLTMDPETGLGKWSEQDFITAVKTGKRPFGKPATAYPMKPFVLLTDEELSAVWEYLNTLEPVHNPKLIAKE